MIVSTETPSDLDPELQDDNHVEIRKFLPWSKILKSWRFQNHRISSFLLDNTTFGLLEMTAL